MIQIGLEYAETSTGQFVMSIANGPWRVSDQVMNAAPTSLNKWRHT